MIAFQDSKHRQELAAQLAQAHAENEARLKHAENEYNAKLEVEKAKFDAALIQKHREFQDYFQRMVLLLLLCLFAFLTFVQLENDRAEILHAAESTLTEAIEAERAEHTTKVAKEIDVCFAYALLMCLQMLC